MTATITAIAPGDSDPNPDEALRRYRASRPTSAVDPARTPPRPPYPSSVSKAFADELATRRAHRPHADLITLAVEVEQHFGGAA